MMGISKVMGNFYYYTFYQICLFVKKVNKRDKDYMFTALIAFSLLLGMNILTIYFLIKKTYGIVLNVKIVPLIMMGAIYALNYFLLMRNDKGKEIINYYALEKGKKNTFPSRIILVILYVILTFVICGSVVYFTKHGNSGNA